jgi:hypothetical protein
VNETISTNALWDSAKPTGHIFSPDYIVSLPEPAQRYLRHTIRPASPIATAVRLRMHGEIRLRRWFSFTAEQVITLREGMVWSATVTMAGIPLFEGFDRLVHGAGEMRWKLFGVVPFIQAHGPDITRSSVGRLMAESVWLPSLLSTENVSWTAQEPTHPEAALTINGQSGKLRLTIDAAGRLVSSAMLRWGNPGGGTFRYEDFGGTVEEEKTFHGYTIPSRLRIGWYFGTQRFETEGEFFRVSVDDAEYK